MKLVCAGASSAGNAFALQDLKGATLFLEAGVRFKEIEKQLAYNIDFTKAALLVSHFHGDHARHLPEYAERGIKCYSNEAVHEKYPACGIIVPLRKYSFEDFIVTAFEVEHDVLDFGYIISHPEMGTLVFFTDAYNVPCVFQNVDHFLIEANYDDNILNDAWIKGKIDKHQRDRLMLSHFSIDNCISYLRECHAENACSITLTHLSSRNADPNDFKERIEKAFGVETHIAKKGLNIELNKIGI